MTAREVAESYWRAMQANDWTAAAAHLAEDCQVDWPCSGERIVGREDFADMQALYPTNTGRWTFDVHRIIAGDRDVVSEVTVSDGEISARLIAISTVDGDRIARQTEYWPTGYEPQPGRAHLTRPIPRVP